MTFGLPSYVIGLDLGQAQDYTAIAVAERNASPTGQIDLIPDILAYFDGNEHLPRTIRVPRTTASYDVIHLERLPLGSAYTEIPGKVRDIEQQVRRRYCDIAKGRNQPASFRDALIDLVIDKTGCGRPVADMLTAAGLDAVFVTIHGGDQVVRVEDRDYRTPKRDLCGAIQSTLQSRRLKAAPSLPYWPALQEELRNFKARISLGGHDSYGAGGGVDEWRTGGAHDDLVLATALAVWYGEYEAAEAEKGRVVVGSYLSSDDDDRSRLW